jgi:hypothetical protein
VAAPLRPDSLQEQADPAPCCSHSMSVKCVAAALQQ